MKTTYPTGKSVLLVAEPAEIATPFSGAIENMVWAPDSQSLAIVDFPLSTDEETQTEELHAVGAAYLLRPGTWDVAQELPTQIPLVGSLVSWSPDSRLLLTVTPHLATVRDSVNADELFGFMTPDEVVPLAARWIGGEEVELAVAQPDEPAIVFWNLTSDSEVTTRRISKLPGESIPVWGCWSPNTYRLALILADGNQPTPRYQLAVIEDDDDAEPNILDLPPGFVENPGWSHVWSPDSDSMAVAVESLEEPICHMLKWNGRDESQEQAVEVGPMSLFGSAWSGWRLYCSYDRSGSNSLRRFRTSAAAVARLFPCSGDTTRRIASH